MYIPVILALHIWLIKAQLCDHWCLVHSPPSMLCSFVCSDPRAYLQLIDSERQARLQLSVAQDTMLTYAVDMADLRAAQTRQSTLLLLNNYSTSTLANRLQTCEDSLDENNRAHSSRLLHCENALRAETSRTLHRPPLIHYYHCNSSTQKALENTVRTTDTSATALETRLLEYKVFARCIVWAWTIANLVVLTLFCYV
jgi:hypothetical protein